MTDKQNITALSDEDRALLHELRGKSSKKRSHKKHVAEKSHDAQCPPAHTLGERVADAVAATMGSWKFIIIQSLILFCWIGLNILGWVKAWDPYPFILLNLALSFQAAYSAPVIMMSQNRQSNVDREKAADDYNVNLKSELEIELLHQKIDMLRETEIVHLTKRIEELTAQLQASKPA